MEPQAISSDLIRGHIDTIILHTLLNEDKFAQQISDTVEQKSGGAYKLNQATLYSSLKRLETLKYVNSYWYDSADVGGRRKYFKLTESGKNAVNANLDSWSFSRAIIDKLMDCEPQPVYKTQYVEKIVEVPVQQASPQQPIKTEENVNLSPETLAEKSETRVENTKLSDESVQEINFRNILNGLIKTTQIKKEKPQQTLRVEPEPIIRSQNPTQTEERVEKLKFNETITTTNYNAHRNNNGKIDFGDLALKAAKEGYKLRISSKDSEVSSGKLMISKLRAASAMIIYLIALLEFLAITSLYKTALNPSPVVYVLILSVLTVFPTVEIIRFLTNPAKKSTKNIYPDLILTVAIVVFNLLLITFAANLLAGVNFYDTLSVIIWVVSPMLIYLDIFIYYVTKYALSKAEPFKVKNTK